ncbi:hypothetical protein A2U01_0028077, partial [Trifolium medium]|nr:hypothetical protein [Trifolium medium]
MEYCPVVSPELSRTPQQVVSESWFGLVEEREKI